MLLPRFRELEQTGHGALDLGYGSRSDTQGGLKPRGFHSIVAHFLPGSTAKDDRYLCLILRDRDTAELAFTRTASHCPNPQPEGIPHDRTSGRRACRRPGTRRLTWNEPALRDPKIGIKNKRLNAGFDGPY